MKRIGLMVLFSVFLLSCTKEDGITSSAAVEEMVTVKISLNVDEMNASQTRSGSTTLNLGREEASTQKKNVAIISRSIDPATVNESAVSNLWVLQYINGLFIKKEYISSVSAGVFQIGLVANKNAETSNLYFIANVGASAFATAPASESVFTSSALAVNTEETLFPTQGYLPLFASRTGITLSSSVLSSFTINLTRMLARIDVNYSIVSSLWSSYWFKARLCNVPDKMYYVSPTGSELFPATVSVWNTDYTSLNSSSGTLTFYIPDNRRGTGSNTAATDEKLKTGILDATYVEIWGEGITEEIIYNIYPGADIYNDYNIRRNNNYKLTAKLNGTAGSDGRVLAFMKPANCYILSLGKSINIPVSQANKSQVGQQLPDLTTGWIPEVIWRDNMNMKITLSSDLKNKGILQVAASSHAGNALVCIKDASNNILWSWHIWVTSYDPFALNQSIGTVTFMDRNLGATSNTPGFYGSLGYIYQWGRKDPFAGASATASGTTTAKKLYAGASGITVYNQSAIPSPTNMTDNLGNSIRYPTTFYCAEEMTPYNQHLDYDWYKGSAYVQDNDLWKSTKTAYDPCPPGWKMPSYEDFGGLTTSMTTWNSANRGRKIISNSAWYPATGYREYCSGALIYVGDRGSYWTTSVFQTIWGSGTTNTHMVSSAFNFDSNEIKESGLYFRAFGHSVRCRNDYTIIII